jgi:hypothetical protein
LALNKVTVTWSEIDAAAAPLGGWISFQLSSDLADQTDGEIVRRNPPKVYDITSGGGMSSPLVANDNANAVPSGSYYTVIVNITGQQVVTFTTQINYAHGSTQTLAFLQANAALPAAQYAQYLPLPAGTPQAGDAPIVIGNGSTATAWGSVTGSDVRTLTSSATLTGAETTVFVNGPGLTVTLMNATVNPGKTVTLKLTYPFTTATITPVSGQTIDGFPSYPLEIQYQWVTLQSDGSNWMVVGAKTAGTLAITIPSLPTATVGSAYTAQLTATGGWPGYTWSVKTGPMPAGLSMDSAGAISGTPITAGTTVVTVQAMDSVGGIITASLSFTVSGGITLVARGATVEAISGLDAHPAFGAATTAGNFLVAYLGSNGTITTSASGWTIVPGSVTGRAIAYKPDCGAGETAPVFSTSGSDIWAFLEEWSGVATTSPLAQHNGSNIDSQAWSASLTNPDSTAGMLIVGCGYWNGSNLGGSVSLSTFTDSTGGAITGALIQGASAYGQYFAGIAGVAGPTGSFDHQVTMATSVYAGGDGLIASFKPANAGTPPPPTITTTSLPDADTGLPYYPPPLAAENGTPPYTWSLASGSMPAGLTLSSGGVISGTPTTAGTTALHLKVTDSAAVTGTATVNLTVDMTPAVTFTSSAAQQVSQGYTVAGITGVTTPVYLNNNVWNPVTGWAQTISAVDPTDWWVVANFPPGNTAVSSYPSNGCYFSETPLGNFSKLVSSFSEQMNPNAGSQCWAGYDIWLNSWANEIMIHHDLARFNPWDNTALAQNVQFGGSNGVPVQLWDLHFYGSSEYVWQPASNAWNEQSGSVDILQMLTWMVANKYLPATNTVTAIGYGWEICSTGGVDEFYRVSSFTMDAVHT